MRFSPAFCKCSEMQRINPIVGFVKSRLITCAYKRVNSVPILSVSRNKDLLVALDKIDSVILAQAFENVGFRVA